MKKNTHKKLWMIVIILLIAAGATGYYFYYHNKHKVIVQSNPVATIKSLPSTSNTQNNGQKTQTTSSLPNQGTSTNAPNPSSSGSDSSTWLQSQSGIITVKTPSSGQKIASGAILSGSAKVSQIQYTLIDNGVGVISQGIINVNSGNFSASISFPAVSDSGRLDVFSLSSSGAEINEVQVPVNF